MQRLRRLRFCILQWIGSHAHQISGTLQKNIPKTNNLGYNKIELFCVAFYSTKEIYRLGDDTYGKKSRNNLKRNPLPDHP